MKNRFKLPFLYAVSFAFIFLLSPAFSHSFETISLGDDSDITVYGFLRNDLGMFINPLPYTENGNQLAANRTTLRLYGNANLSEQLTFNMVGQVAYEPWYKCEEGAASSREKGNPVLRDGKEYSEYDNLNDVLREFNVTWKPNSSFDIKVGRQIVVWGESLTSAVLDVVQPPDLRYGFLVGNQEDARIPGWMSKVTTQFHSINTAVEWIINPNLVSEEYRIGRVGEQAVPAMGQSTQRFAQHPEDRNILPNYIPGGVNVELPDNNLEDLRYGFRTNTLTETMQFGAIYWHTQSYEPISSAGATLPVPAPVPVRLMNITFPNYDIIGLYANKQLSSIPGVLRAEIAYSPNKPYNTLEPLSADDDGIRRRDWVKYMIAYDLNGYLYYQWHKTAPFDITLEHVGEWIDDADNLQFSNYQTEMDDYSAALNLRVSTSWFYGRLGTSAIFGYSTFGDSGLFAPAIDYKPGWFNNNLSFGLKYYHFFANDSYTGMGLNLGKDMIVLTTQLNF